MRRPDGIRERTPVEKRRDWICAERSIADPILAVDPGILYDLLDLPRYMY
jgi:hypothetical protein